METDHIYSAAIYARLSKEDQDSYLSGKNESDSITNQKLLIRSYLAKLPDVRVVETFEDDGYTGTNFDRPNFRRMLDAIRAHRIDCVVVKDFSRLGRDYLEAGNYIEKIFPKLGIRFISINDDYDSHRSHGQIDNLIVPFKNLLNEQYSRDTSGKVRSALSVKRSQGLFVGAFAVFGYFRDPEDKNHMVIDEYAADIVREIFHMRMEGMSADRIAACLNERGILTPADYKRQCGLRYKSGFKASAKSEWYPMTVKRILTNEVYCGHMIQGKRRKVSYKVQAEEYLPPEQWSRVENTHEAIISPVIFRETQRLLGEDTRIGITGEIYPLAGKIYCSDCGGPMIRRSIRRGDKYYAYYLCGTYKHNRKACSSHNIGAEQLEAAVLSSLQAHISLILDMERALSEIAHSEWEQREVKKLRHQIDLLSADITQAKELRLGVYEDFKSGLIDLSEYDELRKGFAEKIMTAEKAQEKLRGELNALLQGNTAQHSFLREFRKYENIQTLDRNAVVAMIEKVLVHNGHEVEIVFRYSDRFASMQAFLAQSLGTDRNDKKEVS